MSGRSHDLREVQIPLLQAPPPQHRAANHTPPPHRPTNHWPPSEAPPPTGGALLPVQGGFRERFVLPPDDKYRCEKCGLVLVQPRQTECGHRFCNSCITELLSRPNPVCPADREPLFPDKIFRDICCQREILALKVFCRSETNGCKEQLSLQQLPDHLTVCPFLEVPCPLGRCQERMMRKDVPEHLNWKCKHRETSCDFCLCKMPLADLQKHKETVCPAFPVSCPNLCSSVPLPRSELHVHQGECPKAQANCPFHRFGCSFKGLKDELKLHESSSVSEHLRMMSSRSSALESKVEDLRVEVSDRFLSLPGLSSRLSETEVHTEDLRERSRQSEHKLTTVQKLLSAHSEKLLELEMEFRSVRSLRDEVENLRTRITALEQTRTGAGTSHALVTLETQLGRHDDMLSVHEIRLADMDLRFQVLETASYNGTLIWKIRDYTRRKQEAVSGKTLSLYSQPFYTSYFGYKMCARVYLNGDGMGKGTHLSLFFVVMRGEYDALLHWPFKQKVTLMLMDQGGARKHLGDAFKPDPNSSSFKRPSAEMNIASGCPLFANQTMLESGSYIKDDTIFIKVTVDTSDLPDP
ncbi:hypothetical protein NQD34_016582 [Periophthalmus magnuspinnatus]|uniref:TNF receptor-associated factor 3 n=1 Tax=Periophthalmus magnuspinnatus TaxID=409849 RepID=UPI00145A622B|nr:TNF receptor-associated factor 3 [Periophthalmus magnuspinnatus]XP_033844468.1 TNF receptor-associated factor 3 [Periophthalmus magnuspinnatus]KAJ0009167.1 hypothetical protein NQD34_016582 [Periophthalmus magnuspinnatus]